MSDLARKVAEMSAKCGFDRESPPEIIGLLEGEVAELREAFWANRLDLNERHSVPEELADCAIYLYHLANQLGIDLNSCIEKKIQKNLVRFGGLAAVAAMEGEDGKV